VIMCGKTIKTDKLDAKFLGGLHPDDQLPEVYIPTLAEEGRRDAERELARLRNSIGPGLFNSSIFTALHI